MEKVEKYHFVQNEHEQKQTHTLLWSCSGYIMVRCSSFEGEKRVEKEQIKAVSFSLFRALRPKPTYTEPRT